MRRKLAIASFLLVAVTVGFVISATPQEEKKPEYVGQKKCKICHSKLIMGGVEYLKWEKAAHSKAYKTLLSEESIKMGLPMGICEPSTEERCLKCHITSNAIDPEKREIEGIGCERCHGPGSLYKKKKVMQDHEASVKAGMRDFKADTEEEELKKIEALCRECHGLEHKEENPAAKEFIFEERWPIVRHDEETMKKEFPEAFK